MAEENSESMPSGGQKKVIVYSTPTCPYCKMAMQYFDEHGVTYTEIDVSVDEKFAEEMVKKSGQMGVPVIDIDGQIIVGFDKDELALALGLE
ncbi:MAG: glutaredoxin family protein [Patescibacteria group bacterium]